MGEEDVDKVTWTMAEIHMKEMKDLKVGLKVEEGDLEEDFQEDRISKKERTYMNENMSLTSRTKQTSSLK